MSQTNTQARITLGVNVIEQVHTDVIKSLARTLGFKPNEVTEIHITSTDVVVTSFGDPKFLPGAKPNLVEHHIKVVHD